MPRKRCISFYIFSYEENQDEEDIGNGGCSSFNRKHGIPFDSRGVCFEMAPVVVTANRMNENLVDARADISVVTSRQIENSI